MSNPNPGWYADPGGCWEERWWDGSAWCAAVRTGAYQCEDPYPPIPPTVTAANEVLASWSSGTVRLGTETYQLTWDSLLMYDGSRLKEQLALWSINGIEVRRSASQHARGVGDVVLSIAYQGYFGPSTFALLGVPSPDEVKAAIRRQIGIWHYYQGSSSS